MKEEIKALLSDVLPMVDFDAEQVLYEGLRDMRVAEHEPEHNRVGDVEFVERPDAHFYAPLLASRKRNIQSAFCGNMGLENYATKVDIPARKRRSFGNSC